MDELDPEVAADIALRESSVHDRTRTRGAGVYAWSTPVVVDRWRCRGNCGGIVTVTEEAQHALEVNNRQLARKNEPPLDTNKIAFCEKCRTIGVTVGDDRNRKHVEALSRLIAELKQNADANDQDHQRERELLQNCRLMHHPDIDGLTLAIKQRREKAASTKPGGRKAL